MLRICIALALLITGPLLWRGAAAQVPPNAVIEWNETSLTIVRTPGALAAPLPSTRSSAILDAAIYDAVSSPASTSAEYTAVFTEVKSLGMEEYTTRTVDQQLIGGSWGGRIQQADMGGNSNTTANPTRLRVMRSS